MNRKNIIKLLSGLAVVILCGVLYLFSGIRDDSDIVVTEGFSDKEVETATNPPHLKESDSSNRTGKIYIHVCGEVKKPGVYTFSTEPRVVEAVKKAGGFTGKADRFSINQAEKITDGTQLVIPAKGKKESRKKTENAGSIDQSGKVNLNTALKEELMTLSGIGESKAAQILSYREENGAFQKIEDIMNISGIKEGIFNRIKNQIVV